jgi:hypothetical protein
MNRLCTFLSKFKCNIYKYFTKTNVNKNINISVIAHI